MKIDSVLDEIQDINLTYLLLAQRLLKEDYATAMFRLKIDQAMAEVLISLSAKQLSQMARTNRQGRAPGNFSFGRRPASPTAHAPPTARR